MTFNNLFLSFLVFDLRAQNDIELKIELNSNTIQPTKKKRKRKKEII